MRKATIVFILLLAPAAAAQEVIRIFPGAASAPGAKGAFFVTDVRLYNPDSEKLITLHLSFLDRDQDNSNAEEIAVEVPPRRGVAFNDVLSTLFGLSNAAGAIRIRSDGPFYATSRTYDIASDIGTFGTFIPGLPEEDAIERGILLQVVNDPTDSGFRANVGFANPGLQAVTATVRVFDADTGELIGERERFLPPRTFSQINDVFRFVGARNRFTINATVEFEADGSVLAYATVVDNASNDPIFVIPFADGGTAVGENRAPNGTITMPSGDRTINAGQSVEFAGTASDPDGDDVTVLWEFGDGVSSTNLEPSLHTYTDPGEYSVTLTATDEHGLADPTPAALTVTVNAAEAATFTRVQNEVFTPSCALSGCHSAGGASAGLSLVSGAAYGNIVNVASSQQPSKDRIVPGDPADSYLWLKVTGDQSIDGVRMPRFRDPLSQELLDLLEDWIESEAPND